MGVRGAEPASLGAWDWPGRSDGLLAQILALDANAICAACPCRARGGALLRQHLRAARRHFVYKPGVGDQRRHRPGPGDGALGFG